MDDNLLKKTTIVCTLFTVVAMSVMVALFLFREVPVNAEGLAYAMDTVMDENTDMLQTGANSKETDYLCVPLPENVTESQIVIVDDYMEHTLSLSIEGVAEDFYYHNSFSGCSDHIKTLMYGYGNETARVDLILDGIYTYEKIIENENLYLKFLPPKEKYNRVVVLDPGHGGESAGTTAYGQTERDIALAIGSRVKELLEEADIKSYMTRTTNEEAPTSSERLALAEAAKADMIISIHANADAKTRVTNGLQVLYSNQASALKAGSRDLAENLEEGMISATQTKSQGCVSQNKIGILKDASMPAVYAEVGYLTNRREALMLGEEEYRNKLAQGIYDGIIKAYEEMENE